MRRRILLLGVAVVSLGVILWVIPPVRARIKAIGVLTESAGIPFPRPWAASVEIRTEEVAPGVVGDLYDGSDDGPVLLFVPGAAREGRGDSRVVRAATAFAKAGRRVFVPELTLYDREFSRSDIDRLSTAMDVLSQDDPIGVLGFSYGGSLALIAAADARVNGDIEFIATLGSYFDLTNVIVGVTTGSTVLDGESVPFETVSDARSILTSATVRLAPSSYRDALERAVDAKDPTGLPPEALTIYDLLTNRDPERVSELVAALPPEFGQTLEDLSPSAVIDAIDAPLYILQSKKDAATPWTEALLLERAAPRSRLALLHHFSHVDPPGLEGWLLDGPRAWWFISWMLAEQE